MQRQRRLVGIAVGIGVDTQLDHAAVALQFLKNLPVNSIQIDHFSCLPLNASDFHCRFHELQFNTVIFTHETPINLMHWGN